MNTTIALSGQLRKLLVPFAQLLLATAGFQHKADFLEVPKLFFEVLVSSGFCSLALQRSQASCNFDNDVIYAEEVLLSHLQLEFCLAATGLVPRD